MSFISPQPYIPPDEYQYQLSHASENRGPLIIAVTVVLITLSFAAVGLRFLARYMNALPWKADDWLMIPAASFEVILCVGNLVCVHFGGGKHYLAVSIDRDVTLIKGFYYIGIGFLITHFFVKMSILFLYKRLFTTEQRLFRICWWLLVTATALSTVIFLFLHIFQCSPIPYFWTRFYPNTAGSCSTSVFSIEVAANAVSSTLDVALLILPLPILSTLAVCRTRKLELCSIFSIGILACVAGFFRIWTVVLANSDGGADASWNGSELLIWTAIEPAIGIFCACFPVFYPVLYNAFRPRRRWSEVGLETDTKHRSPMSTYTDKISLHSPERATSTEPLDPERGLSPERRRSRMLIRIPPLARPASRSRTPSRHRRPLPPRSSHSGSRTPSRARGHSPEQSGLEYGPGGGEEDRRMVNKIYHGRGSRDEDVIEVDAESVPVGEISVRTDVRWEEENVEVDAHRCFPTLRPTA